MTDEENRFGKMQQLKRRMFAMRNGVIADTLRKAGSPFRIIFGLNLPQIAEIARDFGPDSELARELWRNTATRESMLMAPMLVDAAIFGRDEAEAWVATVPSAEVADILCHRLLRHTPYAAALADSLAGNPESMAAYTGLRLMCNIYRELPESALEAARRHADSPSAAVRSLAARMLMPQ